MPCFRALQRAIGKVQEEVGKFSEENQGVLDLLVLTPVEGGEEMEVEG